MPFSPNLAHSMPSINIINGWMEGREEEIREEAKGRKGARESRERKEGKRKF